MVVPAVTEHNGSHCPRIAVSSRMDEWKYLIGCQVADEGDEGPLCFPRSSFLRDQIGSQVGYGNFCSFSGCRHVTDLSRRHFLNAASDYYALSQYSEKFTKQKLSFGWNRTEKISVPKASGTVTYEYNSTSRIVNM